MSLQGREKRFDYVAAINVRCSVSVWFASGERRGSFALKDGLDHRLARVLMEVPDEIEAKAARTKARGCAVLRQQFEQSGKQCLRCRVDVASKKQSTVSHKIARLPSAKHGHCELKVLANRGWANLCGWLRNTMLSYGRLVRLNRHSGTMRYWLLQAWQGST